MSTQSTWANPSRPELKQNEKRATSIAPKEAKKVISRNGGRGLAVISEVVLEREPGSGSI